MSRNLLGMFAAVAVLAGGGLLWWWSSARRAEPAAPVRTAGPVPEIVAAARPSRPVIFVGLDGADWTLLDQYIARGRMPALARLVHEGASGTLTTLHPPLSPLLWTSMLTGVSPLEHRVLDFLRVNPASGQREPITSDERQAPAVWNMATAGGKRTGTFGFWATYPAEAVNGIVVSDRLFTFLFSESEPPPGIVNPSTLDGWARETLRRTEQDVRFEDLKALLPWLREAEYAEAVRAVEPYAQPVSALRRILIETQVYDELARGWFAREQPDAVLVYVQGTDSIGHVFAPYAPPRQPSIPPEDYERYKDVPERYFAAIDQMIERYRQLAASSGGVLVLASDHGFKWGEGRPETLSSFANATAARWHTEDGIFLIWGHGIAASAGHTARGGIMQVAATLVALLGLPPAAGVAGPPLPGTPDVASPPVDYRGHYSPMTIVAAGPQEPSRGDADAIARLRALGYVGGAPASGGRAVGTRTAGSFNNEGLLLKQQGKIDAAIEAFDLALVVDPTLASALWNLSDLLFAQNASLDRSDALLVRAWASGLPEGTRFLIGRAIGYERQGRLERSIKLLTEAAAARSDDPEVWLFRGRYRVQAKDCAAAATDFQRAVRLQPENPAAHASEGIAHLCAGDAAAARASLQRSLALDPKQPKVREYLRSAIRE